MENINFPSVWDFAEGAITTWQHLGDITQVLQVILIGGIVLLAIYMFVRFLRRISAHDQVDL